MFRHEKVFVAPDVIDREALCKRLTENGATIVTATGEQDSIHVFNSFEGGVFEDCVKKGHRVIGVPCVQETLKSGKALPRTPHPVYSRVMEGIVVSGDVVEEKNKLKTCVSYMCGTWTDEINVGTQYFVTTEPGSIHYMWALEFGSHIVLPSWVLESWENHTLSDRKFHALPPLTGCIISVTGLSSATRATIQHLVTHYGGKYTQQLSRKVTHLLCDKPKGRKYMTALAWGIHILSTSWLFDSINAKGTIDVSRYEISSIPQEMDSDALYLRNPYSRSGPYNLTAGARRLNNYTTPILVRRHRTLAPSYVPAFSLPPSHPSHPQHISSSHSHQPVFAQTTQIQSGSSSHSNSASMAHPIPSMRQQTSSLVQLAQQKYSNSTRSRDKDGRTNVERYREMFEQLTGLLRMCDDLIEKCGTNYFNLNNNINNNNNNKNNSINNNINNSINTNLNNNINNNNINKISKITNNINNNNNNISNTSNHNLPTSNSIPTPNNTTSNNSGDNTDTNTNSSTNSNTNNNISTNSNTNDGTPPTIPAPTTTAPPTSVPEDPTDIDMESDEEVATAAVLPTTSSEQEK